MPSESRKRTQFAVAMASVFAVAAALLVLILPGGRETIDYLIAGTFATAVSLAALFAWCVKKGIFSGAETRRRKGRAENP